MEIRKAQRKQAKIKLALQGPSGSGNTVKFKTANGCDSVLINLTIHPSFKPTFTNFTDTLTSDNDYNSYQWYDFNGSIDGATNKTFTINKRDTYYLEATNKNGCAYKSDGIYVILDFTDEIKKVEFGYTIMPNPNRGEFNFRIDTNPPENLTVKLINGLWQVMEVREITYPALNHTELFDVSHLSKGIYYLIILSDNYQRSEKIVVQ